MTRLRIQTGLSSENRVKGRLKTPPVIPLARRERIKMIRTVFWLRIGRFQTPSEKPMTCPICQAQNEDILLQTANLRVIAVHDEAGAPAFCRVIWWRHVAEMTDLSAAERAEIMETVYKVEAAMRRVFRPAKINLASLGNVVPHLHWHVIARFENDANFPAPIWAPAVRRHEMSLPDDWPEQIKALLV